MKKLKTLCGDRIDETIANAIKMAATDGEIEFEFNGVTVQVAADSDPALIYRDWSRGMLRNGGFTVSPYPKAVLSDAELSEDNRLIQDQEERQAQATKAYNERMQAKKDEIASRLAPEIELQDADGWKTFVEKNSDPYGSGVVRFAENWARLMQAEMANGAKLEDIADKASSDADTEGITGFMYGCAVSVLSQVWKHGEGLRRWHNFKTQIGNEGEKANESGGVLDPAVIRIGA